MKNTVLTSLAGLAFLALSATMHDAAASFVDSSRYCGDSGYASSGGTLTAGAVGFSVIGGATYNADRCYGAFDIKEAKTATGGGEDAVLNAIWGGGLTYLGKRDVGGAFSGGSSMGGLVVSSVTATQSGWSIAWVNSSALPMSIDLAVMLKAGSGNEGGSARNGRSGQGVDLVNDSGSWWLPSILLPGGSSVGTGGFTIEWLNKGGRTPDLSNLSLAARVSAPRLAATAIPEPAGLSLLAVGLLGLGLLMRWRRSH